MNTSTITEVTLVFLALTMGVVIVILIAFYGYIWNNGYNNERRLFLLNRLRERIVGSDWIHSLSEIYKDLVEFEIETNLPVYNLTHLLAKEFESLGYQTSDFHCHVRESPNGYSFQVKLDNTDEEYLCGIISCGDKRWKIAL